MGATSRTRRRYEVAGIGVVTVDPWSVLVVLLALLSSLSSTSLGEHSADAAGGIEWTAPVPCPDVAQMNARIEAAGGTGRLAVEGVVTQESADVWQVELVLDLDGERDTRVLRGATCDEVAQAAELLIAVRRDETTVAEEPAPGPPEAVTPAVPTPAPPIETAPAAASRLPAAPASAAARRPPTAPIPTRPRSPAGRATQPLPTGLHLGAAAGIGIGAAPWPSMPLEIVVGLSWPRLRVAARGRYHLARAVTLDGDRRARIGVGTAGVEACARPALARVELPLCGQLGVGGSRADGGGPEIRDRSGVWAELGVDAGIAWHVRPWWALTLRVGAAAVLAGSRYVRGIEVVFDPAPIHGRGVIGTEFHIPIQIGPRPEKD